MARDQGRMRVKTVMMNKSAPWIALAGALALAACTTTDPYTGMRLMWLSMVRSST